MMDYNTGYGAANAVGAGRSAKEPPKSPAALDGPAQHLAELLKGLVDANERLTQVADRFTGAIPQGTQGTAEGNKTGGSGLIGLYHQLAGDYAREMRRLQETLQRLESV